jgi:structural maintenance of chromosome 4
MPQPRRFACSVSRRLVCRYRKKEADYNEKVRDLDSVTSARDVARKEHTDLRKRRLDEFMAGFNVITMKLKEMYQVRTRGRDTEAASSFGRMGEGAAFFERFFI